MTSASNPAYGYRRLLGDTHFQAFLWTQFLGAFNDNVYKIIVSIMAVRIASDANSSSRYLALAGAVFVLPFLLFAGTAGQLADRFSKTRVLQITKAFEILIMIMGIVALTSARIDLLLVVLFLLAMQANFFSPAKYGILPEMMSEAQISRANGLLELSTFIAIVIGTSFGAMLFERWKDQPLLMGATLLGIAVVGSLASLHIAYVPPAGSTEPFHWNPFTEVIAGSRSLLKRKPLLLAILGISWFWFVGALFQLSLILFGKEILHVSEAHVGFLVTALAVGIGLGSVLAGTMSGDHIELGLVPAGSLLMALFSVALGVTHNYDWALCWLAGIGFGGGLFAVPLNAYLQEHAGSEEKGRIIATNNFINMVGVILASGVLWFLHDLLHWNPAIITLALGIAMFVGTPFMIQQVPDRSARFVLWCLLKVLFRVRIDGAERIPREGGALLVSNHISYADGFLIGLATPRMIRFLLWRPFFEMRQVTWIFRTLHAIPIGTDSPKETIRSLRLARAALEEGHLVGIFPEGGVTRDGEIAPFERGYLRIGGPIIPIHMDGLWGHPLSCKNGGLFRSWKHVFRPLVTIRIGESLVDSTAPAELRQTIVDLGRSDSAALAWRGPRD
jgi:acyl-[acyl-carrier-protein]-phospholipid O-acyltransferase/long-chain-fatty-acid--[acyl-carrier-protein] ligase